MKKVVLLSLTMIFLGFLAHAQNDAVDFGNATYDFGQIPQKVPAKHDFKFTNTSDEPIIIENVKASCGCTTPEWSKEAILPGEKGFISAEYNAYNLGNFNKSITVHYRVGNEKMEKIIFIKGEVVEKKG